MIGFWPLRGPSSRSMFDCPPQSQTSPTSTSAYFRVSILDSRLTEVTVSARDSAEALSFFSSTRHWPLASAVVDLVWPAKATVTLLPCEGVAQTEIGRA